jgi:hypothetical protein
MIRRLTEAALTLFGRRPDKYVPTIVRSGNDDQLAETVMSQSNGQVLLNPLLSSLSEGRYRLQFFNASHAHGQNHALSAIEVSWDRDKSPELKSDQIARGLYEVSVSPVPLIEPQSTPPTAWVLVTSADEFPHIVSEFDLLKSGVQQWDRLIPLRVRRAFLRACLESLAGETQ